MKHSLRDSKFRALRFSLSMPTANQGGKFGEELPKALAQKSERNVAGDLIMFGVASFEKSQVDLVDFSML